MDALLRNDDDDDSNATEEEEEEEERIFFSSSFTLLQKTTPDRERGLLACALSGGGVFDSDDFDAFFYPILWGKKWVFLERDIIQRYSLSELSIHVT